MTNWTPGLTPPWSTSDLDGILNDALRVLSEIGIKCTPEGVRSRLAEYGGFSFKDQRVHFSEAGVRAHLEKKREAFEKSNDDEGSEFTLGDCWAGLNYCDPETREIRPASSEEAAQMARLWDARGHGGVVPIIPGDVSPALTTLAAERIALENSRFMGGKLTVIDPEEVRFLIDMNGVVGRRYHLVEQVGISPLQWNAKGLETALCFLHNSDVDVSLGGSIPMAGATCPLDPRSAVVQSVAEALGVDILRSVLGIASGGLNIRVDPFDFQYQAIVFGSPEWCLYEAAAFQMAEHLTGQPTKAGRFRTVAKRPNAQAACERTASVLWQALLGIRHFGAVGQLSVDEVFSPQQAVLDREILGYVERTLGGLDLDQSASDPLAIIDEGVREGDFIGVADTVERFREFFYFPEIFRHWNLGRWRAEGEPSILAEAWAHARQEIATSTHAIEEKQQHEISEIYRKAENYLRNS